MKRRIQHKDENPAAYLHAEVRLCPLLELSVRETKKQIAAGLLSKELAMHITTAHFVDEDALFAGMCEFDKLMGQFSSPHTSEQRF